MTFENDHESDEALRKQNSQSISNIKQLQIEEENFDSSKIINNSDIQISQNSILPMLMLKNEQKTNLQEIN